MSSQVRLRLGDIDVALGFADAALLAALLAAVRTLPAQSLSRRLERAVDVSVPPPLLLSELEASAALQALERADLGELPELAALQQTLASALAPADAA